jgi:hypothetical protein
MTLRFLENIGFDIIDTVNDHPNKKEILMANADYERFKYLKSMFRQDPLSSDELNELTTLAEKYNHKLAAYLKENRGILF